MNRALPLPLLAAALLGCGGPAAITDDGANPNPACHPLSVSTCFYPFPSAYFEKADSATETGRRLAIPKGALPKNQVGEDFDPWRYNFLDGWSLSSQLLADLGTRVDNAQFVGELGDWTETQKAQSRTQIFEFATGARVPHFAEVDANATNPEHPQVVLLHPMERLKPNTRYVVALQRIVDTKGANVEVKPFRALVDGKIVPGGRLEPEKARYEEILGFLDTQGLARADLTLAWDFNTASDKQGWGNLVAMRDAAFKRWKEQDLGVRVTDVKNVENDPLLIRRIEGVYDVPSFQKNLDDPFSEQNMDAMGRPVDSGKNYPANILIQVPKCAETAEGPLPILIYGHGNFGSRTEIEGGDDKTAMNSLCMVFIATDWIGQADGDEARFGAKAASFDKVPFLFDRMQQGQVNFLVMARLAAQKLPKLPELQLNGKPIVDGKQIYYYGNSQGGIYGVTFTTLSPEVTHGVFGVGAANYSVMVWRSRDFEVEKNIMDFLYPVASDQQILWMLAQNIWDRVDPYSFVARTVRDPLPDETGKKMAPKQVLWQEGRYDMQVPNLATRLAVRAMGVPLLLPAPEPTLFKIEAKEGPLDSAYTQWDFHAEPPPPPTNAPGDKGDAMGEEPDGSTGQSVHEAIRRMPQAIEMMKRFLKPGGKVENTCGGPCDFPKK